MIQDIAPGVLHQEYTPVLPKENDTVFLFQQRQVLAREEASGAYRFPTVREVAEALSIRAEELLYLFRIDENPYFLILDETEGTVPRFEYISLMKIRWASDNTTMFSCMTAFHLFTWYDKARFCGRCGTKLQHAAMERMMKCPECGNMVYPMIAPAVIVGVIDGEHLLMTKYAGRAYKGWALIAGFCEIGESVEDTVRREVMEEAGIRVKNLRYVASQPWGTDSNLLIGMFCELDGDRQIHMDQEELSRALWVERKDVPDMRDNQSLTGHMIELFRTGREKEGGTHD